MHRGSSTRGNGNARKSEERETFKNKQTPPRKSESPYTVVPHAVYRQQFLDEFVYRHIPLSLRNVYQKTNQLVHPWFMLLVDHPFTTKALESSVMAVCTARIGRDHDDMALVNESLNLYSLGLRELQKALWNPKLMYNDEILAACMALSMYEVVECPGGTYQGWLSHQNGSERLIQLRGAEAHCEGLGHRIFLTFRTTSVSLSFPPLKITSLVSQISNVILTLYLR